MDSVLAFLLRFSCYSEFSVSDLAVDYSPLSFLNKAPLFTNWEVWPFDLSRLRAFVDLFRSVGRTIKGRSYFDSCPESPQLHSRRQPAVGYTNSFPLHGMRIEAIVSLIIFLAMQVDTMNRSPQREAA